MKVIKRQSKKTYTGADKKERHFYNYYLQCDNGKRILIKPVLQDDYSRLEMIAEYER